MFVAFGSQAATPPGLLDNNHAAVRAVIAVQHEVTAEWMRRPEVLGTAVGLDAAGAPALVVYVDETLTTPVRWLAACPRACGVSVFGWN